MTLLRRIQDLDVGLPASEFVLQKERTAARGVLLMGKQVALMYSTVNNYYKLPGGGVEDGELFEDALRRELLEETGCTVVIDAKLGEIIEERGDEGFRQHSIGFTAYQTGSIGEPSFTETELSQGFELRWANDIDQAIALVDDADPSNGGGSFMKLRDSTFLRAAKTLLEGN